MVSFERLPSVTVPPERRKRQRIAPFAALMLLAGPSNFVLYKVLFAAYGPASAVFVMQGVNLLYVTYGAVALYVVRREITPEMRACPKGPFAIMALLDCLGGLLAALGAAGTPGQLQTLLNQSLAPCTMFVGAALLGRRYCRREVLGAGIIFCGGAVVVAPALLADAAGLGTGRSTAVLTYWASNLPMALSAVFKEWRFAGDDVHVIYLTQWVSMFQFCFGFLVAPAECLPGVAAPEGLSPRVALDAFGADAASALAGDRRILLLVAYVLNNFCLNVNGLVVTKRAGAALSAILYALLLPLSTLAFGLPFLGVHREPIQPTTLAGLAIVFLGFLLYEADGFRDSIGEAKRAWRRVRSFGELQHLRSPPPEKAAPAPRHFSERTFSLPLSSLSSRSRSL